MWFGRIIKKYGFVEGEDFCTILGESKGGRRPVKYFVTIGMAKELCMIDNSDIGKKVRRAYIKLENDIKQKTIVRMVGIEARKSMTDRVKESGENERMHGHGYSNFTKLVYKTAGIEYKKEKNFRSSLNSYDLERVTNIEKMIDSLLSFGNDYKDIKEALSKVLVKKNDEVLTNAL